jgi:hypothetical protein
MAGARETWWERAACFGLDTEIWFQPPIKGDPLMRRIALEVCGSCPVAEQCLASALAEERHAPRDFRHGIRGGLDPGQRDRLAKSGRA